jgi:hypothetical protein
MSAFSRKFTALGAVVALSSAASAADQFVGVRDDGKIVTFDSTSPQTFASAVTVIGLAADEIIVGTSIRPTDGVVFAVGSTSRLYQIQPDTGFAAAAGGFVFSPPLDGTDFGVAFDPSGELLRVTSNTGQNLVLNPANGTTASVDPPLVYAQGDANAGLSAGIVACGWSVSQQTGARLYGIDFARGLLVWIDVPTAGSVRTVGPLGVGALVGGGFTGFDVSPSTGVAYAELAPVGGSTSRLYSINLATGAAAQVGSAMTSMLRGASVVPTSPPAPAGTPLVALVFPNHLYTVSTDKPQRLQRTVHVRGLPLGDSFLGVAVRPKNGILYGLTRTALYDIDQSTGTAQRVGTGFVEPLPAGPVSCDFDPRTDKLRVAGGTSVNQSVNPDTGALVDSIVFTPEIDGDSPFAYASGDPRQGATPSVGAIAFAGRDTPTSPSKAYVLETNAALLARLGDPADAPGEARDGKLYSIGLLSIDGVASLPPGRALVTTSYRTAYAALQAISQTSTLYHVDLTNGKSKLVGSIAAPGVVQSMTVGPTANPPRVTVRAMRLGMNYRLAGRDTLTLVGSVPHPVGALDGKVLTVDVGGVSKSFTLDSKGRGKIDYDATRVAGASPHGLAWRMTWRRQDLVPALIDEQMNGLVFAQRDPRQIEVKVTMDGKSYRTLVDLAYTARPGRVGVATKN